MEALSYEIVCLVTSAVILLAGSRLCVKQDALWGFVAFAGIASLAMRCERCVFRNQCGHHTSSHKLLYTIDYTCAVVASILSLTGCLGPMMSRAAILAVGLFCASNLIVHDEMRLWRSVHAAGHVVTALTLIYASCTQCPAVPTIPYPVRT